MSDGPRLVVEFRSSAVAEVRFPERVITVLAVPYEQPTDRVIYKGRQYIEMFQRGAFAGINNRDERRRCMVNREHVKGRTVGRVERWDDQSVEGLISEQKIAATKEGDEVLQLASESMIFPSIGFGVKKGSDQELDHRSIPGRRIIKRAFADHMAWVEDPAYVGADVLSIRNSDDELVDAATLPHIETPRLDEWVAYVASRRAGLTA